MICKYPNTPGKSDWKYQKKYSILSLCQPIKVDFLEQKPGEDITTLDKIVQFVVNLITFVIL